MEDHTYGFPPDINSIYYIIFWVVVGMRWCVKMHHQEKEESKRIRYIAVEAGVRDTIGINGKFYLWKLYTYEFIENWIQYYNLQNISCMMPIEFSQYFL